MEHCVDSSGWVDNTYAEASAVAEKAEVGSTFDISLVENVAYGLYRFPSLTISAFLLRLSKADIPSNSLGK